MFQMNSKLKNILGVISDILLILIIIIAIIITVMTFTSKSSDSGIGNVLGYTPFSIQSNSMAPTFASGDLIIGKEVKDINELKVGDVITYTAVLTDGTGKNVRGNNTHRIDEIEYNPDGTVSSFRTKGDAGDMTDAMRVTPDEVLAKQVNSGINEDGTYKKGVTIKSLGTALNFLQSRTGFMICIIIPLALFFIWQIYKLIAMFMEVKASDIDEDTKRRAVEEYLAEQAAKEKTESEKKSLEGPEDKTEKTEEIKETEE